jgi:hypothetical protein
MGYSHAGSYWTFLRQLRPPRPAGVQEREVRFDMLPYVGAAPSERAAWL